MLDYDKKVTAKGSKIMENVVGAFEAYRDLYYKFTMEKVHHMNEFKEKIYREILNSAKTVPKQELLILYELHQSLELYRMMTEIRMAIEY